MKYLKDIISLKFLLVGFLTFQGLLLFHSAFSYQGVTTFTHAVSVEQSSPVPPGHSAPIHTLGIFELEEKEASEDDKVLLTESMSASHGEILFDSRFSFHLEEGNILCLHFRPIYLIDEQFRL